MKNLLKVVQDIKASDLVNFCRDVMGYDINEDNNVLNLFGIRNDTNFTNSFDDVIVGVYKDETGKYSKMSAAATTDPGLYHLKYPSNINGTAILKPGCYKAWKLGLHQGKYTAFKQCRPVTVWRDKNKDLSYDYDNYEDKGIFGINIHRASATGTSKQVDKWSAGCQVIASIDDWNKLMDVAQTCVEYQGIDFIFTYCLMDVEDITRLIIK